MGTTFFGDGIRGLEFPAGKMGLPDLDPMGNSVHAGKNLDKIVTPWRRGPKVGDDFRFDLPFGELSDTTPRASGQTVA